MDSKISIFLVFFFIFTFKSGSFLYSQELSGLQLWLIADSVITEGGKVTQWSDISGNNYHAIQPDVNKQPLLIDNIPELNSKPSIKFDGINDFFNGVTISGIDTSSISILIITAGDNQTGTEAGLFTINTWNSGFWLSRRLNNQSLSFYNNGSYLLLNAGSLPNSGFSYKILEGIKTFDTNTDLLINGNILNSSNNSSLNGSFTNTDFVIGHGQPFQYFNGYIAEILVYNKALTESERIDVEQYFRNKYAPQVNLGVDINIDNSFCDTALTLAYKPWFDIFLWSTGETDSVIHVNQPGIYSVTVTDIFGFESTDSIKISYPNVNLFNDTLLCFNDTIIWNTDLTNDYNFVWSNTSTDSLLDIYQAGEYFVSITDGYGCSFTTNTIHVKVDSFPFYTSLGEDLVLCSGNNINLDPYPDHLPDTLYNNLTYLWGDSSSDSVLNIISSGDYSISVTNVNLCSGLDTVNVSISGVAPTPLFSTDTVCLGNATSFTDQSIGFPDEIESWLWDFGDSNTSSVPNPIHTYSTSGIFIVNLTVASNTSCDNTITKTVLVKDLPVADFQIEFGYEGCINTDVQFLDKSTPVESVLNYIWDFDNGNFSNSVDPTEIFGIEGSYNVSLQVEKVNGCTNTVTKPLNIVINANPIPEISTISPLNDAVFTSDSILFKWNKAENDKYYQFQLSNDIYFSNILFSKDTIATELILKAPSYDSLFWRVFAYNICNEYVSSTIRKIYPFSPTNLNGLQLWLIADSVISNNDTVSQWNDISGNNYHAIQTDVDKQPLLIDNVPELNSKPSIKFDGNNDLFNGVTIPGLDTTSLSIFILTAGDNQTGTEAGLFTINTWNTGFWLSRRLSNQCLSLYNNNSYIFSDDESLPNSGFTYKILEGVKSFEINTDVLINGNLLNSSNNSNLNGSFTNQDYIIGYSPGFQHFNGNIAEILVYNKALSDSERNKIEQYFRYKYAPPVNLGANFKIPYGFCDTAITTAYKPWFTSYLWSTGETDSVITVNQTGQYSVTVTDIFGFESSDDIMVYYPEVDQLEDSTICSGNIIDWNTNLNHHYDFLWQDNSTDSLISISEAGEYFLKITDALGCTFFTDTIEITLDDFYSSVYFDDDTLNLCSGNTIQISSPNFDNSFSYLWSEGSSDTLLEVSISDFYHITVTNNNSCEGTDSVYANILGEAPTVDFEADSVCLGLFTNFNDLSYTTDGSNITSWEWDFGNSQSNTIQNPSVLYDSYGTYIVSLNVISDNSCVNSFQKNILVYDKPIVDFNTLSMGCTNNTLAFYDLSTNPINDTINSWVWDFGDDITDNNQNTSHSYSSEEVFNVSLSVNTNKGCVNSTSKSINIVSSYNVPTEFSLIYPNDNFNSCDTTINFSWNYTSNAYKYKIEISNDSFFDNIIHHQETNLNNIQIPINSNLSIFWRIKAFNICKDSITSDSRILNFFSPEMSDSIQLWLIADSVISYNDTVSQWNDISGNNYHAFQTDVDKQPLLIDQIPELNSKPTIKFDGNNDLFNGATIPGLDTTSISIFIIAAGDNQTGTEAGLFTINNWNSGFWLSRRLSNQSLSIYNNNSYLFSDDESLPNSGFSYRILEGIKSFGINTDILINGNVLNSSNNISLNGPFTNTDYIIGYSPGFQHFNGNIAEILVYNKDLSETERIQIEQYLRYKYAPPVNLGANFKIPHGFCDTAITTAYKPWFTSYLWSTGETDSVITVNQTGQYAVTVTDIFGFESSDSILVYYPEVDQLEDSTICHGDVISWNTSLNHHYDFLWQDNSTDSLISISEAGEYFLKITDTLGCTFFTDTIEVTVDLFPITTSLGEDDSLCIGSPLTLEVGAEEAMTYLWNDNSTEDHIIIEGAGSYSVTVSNALGCMAEDTIQIQIKGIAPLANFTNMAQCLGDITQFTDVSESQDQSNIVEWQWDFGDMNNSNLQSPEHLFADTGLYQVNLHITTDSTCESTLTKEITIYSNPKASFTKNGLCSGQLISFINTSTSIMGSIEYTRWDFGNNDTTNEYSTQRQFNEAGEVNVQLKVKSLYGCEDQIESLFNIAAAPVADFNYTPLCKNEPVIFYDQSEYPAVYNITSWEWETSTEQTASTEQSSFIFEESGALNVFLKVKSLNGCTDTISKSLWIYDQPTALFETHNVCVNHPIQVENLSMDEESSLQTFHWWVNQEVVSQDKVPFYLANDTGKHHIKLKVLSASGCSDTTSGSFIVYPRPYSGFTVSKTYGIPHQLIHFTADSLNDNFEYEFLFGDAQNQNLSNSAHAYTSAGLYQPRLIVNNQYLCSDSSSRNIQIVQPQVDLAISNVKTTSIDGKTGMSVLLSNIGNLEITDITFRIEMSDQTVFEETFSGSIPIGQSLLYDLHAQFLTAQNSEQYLCLYADINSLYEDIDLSNNSDCYSDNMDANFIKLYPNPVKEEITLLYRSDADTPMEYKIIDGQGKEVIINKIFSEKGLQKYQIPVYNLQEGIYLFKIDNTCVKFVKMN